MSAEDALGTQAPLVSICIANFNGEQLLDECLESVYAQTLKAPVEILVHDDASSDGSLGILRSRHASVEVIESKQNVGYCLSNNRMAERASGEFLLLLNNDATLQPDALEVLVESAKAGSALCILTLPQYDRQSGCLVDRGVRLDFLYTPVPNREVGCKRLAYVQGACLFLRRSAWTRLGGFPAWMVSNVEDTYLCLLARLKGGDVRVIEQSGYRHRQGASFGGNRSAGRELRTSYRRRHLSERNRACLVLVCTPTWIAWPWFFMHLMALTLEGLILSGLMRNFQVWKRIYWPALRESIGLLETLCRARVHAQSGRAISFWAYVRLFDKVPHKLRMLLRHGLPRLS